MSKYKFTGYARENGGFLSYNNKRELRDFLADNQGKEFFVTVERTTTVRTPEQNSALWLFFTQLATTLNDMGLDMRKVLKPTYFIPWTKDSIHDNLWIPIQKAMFKTESTKDLKKIEEIDKIHEVIMRELGEKHQVEYIPFPVDEERQANKLR